MKLCNLWFRLYIQYSDYVSAIHRYVSMILKVRKNAVNLGPELGS